MTTPEVKENFPVPTCAGSLLKGGQKGNMHPRPLQCKSLGGKNNGINSTAKSLFSPFPL